MLWIHLFKPHKLQNYTYKPESEIKRPEKQKSYFQQVSSEITQIQEIFWKQNLFR